MSGDVEAVRKLLLDEARAHPLFLAEPAPSVAVNDADNLGVTVRFMAWASTQADAFTITNGVREKVLAKLPGVATPVGLNWSGVAPQSPPQ